MRDIKPFQISKIIEKYLRNISSKEEEIELNDWLMESQDNRDILESFKGTGISPKEVKLISSFKSKEGWKAFKQKRRKNLFFLWSKYAGAAILILVSVLWISIDYDRTQPIEELTLNQVDLDSIDSNAVSLILSDGREVYLDSQNGHLSESDGTTIFDHDGELHYKNTGIQSSKLQNELKTPKGITHRLVLSDGTKVWLNSMSSIKFPVRFSENERKVYLEGEAYFEVTANNEAPFIVELEGKKVEVLGTSFNINMYSNVAKTTLVEGSLKVWNDLEYKVLLPGEQATVKDKINVSKADVEKILAWQNGEFYFKSDPLFEITEQLERWYDMDFKVIGEVPKDIKITGRIRRDAPIDEVLELLSFASNVKFAVNGNVVSIRN